MVFFYFVTTGWVLNSREKNAENPGGAGDGGGKYEQLKIAYNLS